MWTTGRTLSADAFPGLGGMDYLPTGRLFGVSFKSCFSFMKTSNFIITFPAFVLAATILAVSSQAQTAAPLAVGPAPTSYAVVSRAANSAIWERTVYELSPSGQVIPRTNHVVEMATGLNFKDPQTGQWTPSKEEIDILPDGTAVANHGQHTVLFPADIAQGMTELTTPDEMHLKSRPLGIFF